MNEKLNVEGLTEGEQVIGPIEGWRVWKLDEDAPCLLSPNWGRVWLPRQAKAAKCHKGPGHEAPSKTCECGIYAVRTREDLDRSKGDVIVGRVALWGRIIVHESGFRAQYAYPKELFVPNHLGHCAAALAELYGVKTHTEEPQTAEPERFPKRTLSIGAWLAFSGILAFVNGASATLRSSDPVPGFLALIGVLIGVLLVLIGLVFFLGGTVEARWDYTEIMGYYAIGSISFLFGSFILMPWATFIPKIPKAATAGIATFVLLWTVWWLGNAIRRSRTKTQKP